MTFRSYTAAILSLVEWVISDIPGGLGRRLRYIYYKRRLAFMGKGVIIDRGVQILKPEMVKIGANSWIDSHVIILAGLPDRKRGAFQRKENPLVSAPEGWVVIGKNCHIAPFAILQGHGGLEIGDDSGIASGSKIYSLSFHYSNPNDSSDNALYKYTPMSPPSEQSLISAPVYIGKMSAITLNCIVLPGSSVGDGAWIGAGSLVSGGIPPRTLWAGTPAKMIRENRMRADGELLMRGATIRWL